MFTLLLRNQQEIVPNIYFFIEPKQLLDVTVFLVEATVSLLYMNQWWHQIICFAPLEVINHRFVF